MFTRSTRGLLMPFYAMPLKWHRAGGEKKTDNQPLDEGKRKIIVTEPVNRKTAHYIALLFYRNVNEVVICVTNEEELHRTRCNYHQFIAIDSTRVQMISVGTWGCLHTSPLCRSLAWARRLDVHRRGQPGPFSRGAPVRSHINLQAGTLHIGEEKIAAGSFHSPTVLSAAAGNQRRSAAVK